MSVVHASGVESVAFIKLHGGIFTGAIVERII
jgi:hypothetical protein